MTDTPVAEAGNANGIGFDQAAEGFLDYLTHYRGYSASTVRACQTDLRMFRSFLESRLGHVPTPAEVKREHIIQFGVSLREAAPLTLFDPIALLSLVMPEAFNFQQVRIAADAMGRLQLTHDGIPATYALSSNWGQVKPVIEAVLRNDL